MPSFDLPNRVGMMKRSPVPKRNARVFKLYRSPKDWRSPRASPAYRMLQKHDQNNALRYTLWAYAYEITEVKLTEKERKKNKVNAHLTRTVISEAGIRPNKVPKKKVENGTSTIGDAKLMNVFGSVGVTRRNSMKFSNLSLCWAIWLKSFAYFTSS